MCDAYFELLQSISRVDERLCKIIKVLDTIYWLANTDACEKDGFNWQKVCKLGLANLGAWHGLHWPQGILLCGGCFCKVGSEYDVNMRTVWDSYQNIQKSSLYKIYNIYPGGLSNLLSFYQNSKHLYCIWAFSEKKYKMHILTWKTSLVLGGRSIPGYVFRYQNPLSQSKQILPCMENIHLHNHWLHIVSASLTWSALLWCWTVSPLLRSDYA